MAAATTKVAMAVVAAVTMTKDTMVDMAATKVSLIQLVKRRCLSVNPDNREDRQTD